MDLMGMALEADAAEAREGVGYGHVPDWMGRPFPPGIKGAEGRLSSNPKDAIGRTKAPMHLIPPAALIAMAHVFGLGAKKYGAYNWRDATVAATVYVSAAQRHLAAFMDGETIDPESGQPHVAHVAACMAILVDAFASGNVVDDRPKAGPAPAMLRKAIAEVRAAQAPMGKAIAEVRAAQAHMGVAVEISKEELDDLMNAGPQPGYIMAPRAPAAPAAEPRKPFMWYVATPYAACPDGKSIAYIRAFEALRELTRREIVAFSPIAHNHHAGDGLPKTHEFWMNVDRPFMDRCDGLLVMKQPGWTVSSGISEEIDTFRAMGKPVLYCRDPNGSPRPDEARAAYWDDTARNIRAAERGEG